MGLERDMVWRTYTADDGTEYTMKVQKLIGDSAYFGFSALNSALPVLPRKYARVVYMQDAVGRVREYPVGAADADAWVNDPFNFNIPALNDADGALWDKIQIRKEKVLPKGRVVVSR